MEVSYDHLQPGDIVAFKGEGITFKVLSSVLSLVEPSWRRRKWKPWHVAVVMYLPNPTTLVTFEAVGGEGNQLVVYDDIKYLSDTKFYRFLPEVPSEELREGFVGLYQGWPYDNWAYVWVILGWIWHRLTGKWWHVVDQANMCWETVISWARFTHYPLQLEWEFPFLPRILEKLES